MGNPSCVPPGELKRTVTPDGTLILDFNGVQAGWEQWFLLTSDRHLDSPDSDRALQRKHLEQARERNARVLDFGDLFDAMGGRNDRRGSKGSILPQHQADAYFTAVLDEAVEWLAPYADLFTLIGTGNHEASVTRHQEFDLTRQLVRLLNAEAGAEIHAGAYAGWVILRFHQPGKQGTGRHRIRYTHGSGGSSPVTRGVIQTNRRAVYLPDADTILSGHVHQSWQVPIVRERITQRGRVFFDEQTHVQIPSYKRSSLHRGFAAERGFAPTPLGGWWLRFWLEASEVRHEFTRAQ